VIGAQGALGRLCAEALRSAGFDVIRAGRRPESAPDFRLLDLGDAESIPDACRDVDLVVCTASHPSRALERFVLSEGDALLSACVYSIAERAELRALATDARGLVVTDAGLAPGVASLVFKEMLAAHPEADELEAASTLSMIEPAGRGTAVEAYPALRNAERRPAITVELPAPYGPRRCLQLAGAEIDDGLFGGLAERMPVRTYVYYTELPIRAGLLTLNAFGLLSRLPLAVLTAGSSLRARSTLTKPQCHICAVLRDGRRIAARAVIGSGNYAMSAAAMAAYAEALLPRRDNGTAPKGFLGIEDALDLAEVRDGLERRGMRFTTLS
jgi:hypothetical protein